MITTFTSNETFHTLDSFSIGYLVRFLQKTCRSTGFGASVLVKRTASWPLLLEYWFVSKEVVDSIWIVNKKIGITGYTMVTTELIFNRNTTGSSQDGWPHGQWDGKL